jgi:DNA topoisomerase I
MPYRFGRIHLHVEDFEEVKHPRAKSGKHGGEFVKKGQTGGTQSSSKQLQSAPERANWPEHIKKLRIPPAWTDVKINNDPKANLMAVGRDAKGRMQYVYSEKFAQSQSAKKFARVKNLSARLKQFEGRNDKNLTSGNDRVREHAAVLGLIMATGIRPGSERDTKADKTAYGATTLAKRHIVKEGNDTYLQFVGKKGVPLKIPIDDTVLADQLVRRAELLNNPDGQMFPNVTDKSLRDYTADLTKHSAKPKDFRTLLGTSLANELVQSMPKPTSQSAYKKAVMEVAKRVSEKLGNTPAVAIKSYISPFVFSNWKLS